METKQGQMMPVQGLIFPLTYSPERAMISGGIISTRLGPTESSRHLTTPEVPGSPLPSRPCCSAPFPPWPSPELTPLLQGFPLLCYFLSEGGDHDNSLW